MSRGARNMHAIAAVLERARVEAFDRPCIFRTVHGCTGPTIGFIETWDLRQNPLCQAHADQGERMGYRIHTREELGLAPRTDHPTTGTETDTADPS